MSFLDALARLPMGRVPELVELAAERDPAAVTQARHEAARVAGETGLTGAVGHGDELVRRWAAGLLRDDRLGVPGYDTQGAMLDPEDRAAAAGVARDTLLAFVLGDRLDRGSLDLLLAPWHAFLSPTPAPPREGPPGEAQ